MSRGLQRHMMNLVKRTVVLLWVITEICSSVATEPCNTANVLPNMDKRGLSDHPPTGSHPIDDHYNIPDGGSWYRVEGQQMLTNISTAGIEMCGTTFPIYMQGAIPKLTDGIVSRTVCTITFGNTCSHPQHIKIKVCQDFTAYFLSPPRSTGSAYCFVTEDETSVAPTYLIPKPSLSNKLVNESIYQRLQFKCSFEPSLEDLYYQVFWFVDDKPLYVSKMAKKTEPETFVLQEKTGVLEKLGINIACSVRAKTKPDGVPGPMSQKSVQFYAGITVKTPTVTVYRGGATHRQTYIVLKPTVPIGCPPSIHRPCIVNVEISIPPRHQQCTGSIGSVQQGQNNKCGVQISHLEWDREHRIEVFWVDDQAYTINANSYKVSMHTILNNYRPLWGGIRLSDVSVQVSDETQIWKGKECHAICDPHMKTFDGRNKPKDMIIRTLVHLLLYEHDDSSRKVQVQMTVTSCNPPLHVYCVCAIAVRAGGDVFVIDRCPTTYRPIFEFRSCEDNILDVRKINENNYKIYFPSGTYLDAHLWHYTGKDVMDLHMFPSTSDADHTRGLCGVLNGITNDDFLKPDGSQTQNNNQFSQSWRVQERDNLITMDSESLQKLEVWNKTVQFCTCNEHGQNNAPIQKIQCSQNTIATCVKKDEATVKKQQRCKVKATRGLRKESVITSPGHFSRRKDNIMNQLYKLDYQREVTGNWNATYARTYCETFLKQSSSFEACSQDITVTDPKSAEDTCVLDIMATQTTMWSSSARESLKSVCLKELKQNTTYQEEDSPEQPSIAQKIKEIACPNECTGNGLCVNGTCTCNANFGAADCSIDIRVPPQIYGVNMDSNGTCDIRTCEAAIIEGETFVDFGNLTCHYQLFEISINGTEEFATNMTLPGQFNTLVEVFCPLPDLWNDHITKRSTDRSSSRPVPFVYRWSVAVSNDGEHFGEVSDLIVYNADCQLIVDVSVSLFELEDEYCFIRGTCARDGETDASDQCSVCKLDLTRFEWSKNNDFCRIGDLCVANHSVDAHNNCSICNVALSSETWSQNPDYCSIDDACVPDGIVKNMSSCLICNTSRDVTQWSLADDYCLIDGHCVADNVTREGDACSVCNVTISQSTWSGSIGHCMVDGACIADGTDNSNATCRNCDVRQSTNNWTLKPDYCLIDGHCVADNVTREGDACSVCNVLVSQSAWSGHMGYCMLDGVCVPDLTDHSSETCLECDVTQSRNDWTLKPGYCLITGQCIADNVTKNGDDCSVCNVKLSQTAWSENTDFCRIEGQCIRHNTSSNTDKCLTCDVGRSRDHWTRTCETTHNADPSNRTSGTTHNIRNVHDGPHKEKAGTGSSSKAWIAGPVIGGVIIVMVISILLYRRWKNRNDDTSYKVTYVASAS
ncbi:von Willebrand factor D and EGF domain-containing protein-like [Pecten maximus]|uniref:von Willebrand factor D and EGF domain-containing protein-like n=1 Tax=Pecten maximus TaxID=6579 RepID=UPI00145822B9|nr:von Willebrand factor D and EGF domain-containing protein-like [Pecten maximus]